MIRYALKCSSDHAFESWFQSAVAYDALADRRLVACPTCGDTAVEKTLMAPSVRPARAAVAEVPKAALSTPQNAAETALATLRRDIEANSDYVGVNFVTEARRIHAGNAPERPIYGEAKLDEARKLIEDGVPVAPLPFIPARKTN